MAFLSAPVTEKLYSERANRHIIRGYLGGSPEKSGVVRTGSQAARDAQDRDRFHGVSSSVEASNRTVPAGIPSCGPVWLARTGRLLRFGVEWPRHAVVGRPVDGFIGIAHPPEAFVAEEPVSQRRHGCRQ